MIHFLGTLVHFRRPVISLDFLHMQNTGDEREEVKKERSRVHFRSGIGAGF